MKVLVDKYGRIHDYLRISLTNKCNFRCVYCLPKGTHYTSNSDYLTDEEIIKIASTFVNDFGIKKIRLTGGEPLIRKNFRSIINDLSRLNVELALTTNGFLLHNYLDDLQNAGLTSINISLDSLNSDTFQKITDRNVFNTVIKNIILAFNRGFKIKVNIVLLKGINDNEINDFIKWTSECPIHIRFIEFMPFNGNSWEMNRMVPFEHLLKLIEQNYKIEKLNDDANSTSKCYRVVGFKGTFAVISSITAPFCSDCNRIRVTADGKLKNCLFSHQEVDLLSALRNKHDIHQLIQSCIVAKHYSRGGKISFNAPLAQSTYEYNRCMNAIGG